MNNSKPLILVMALALLSQASCHCPACPRTTADQTPSPYAFEETDDALTLRENGEVRWAFQFAQDNTKPFFSELRLPGGANVLWVSPKDHFWHYGLWFSWKYVNGVNAWEENRDTGQAACPTRWDPPELATRADGSATVQMSLGYHPDPDAPAVLKERREIVIAAPHEDGSVQMDWVHTFTAVQRVELNRTPPTPARAWGGYAGLSVRFAAGMTDRVALTEDGGQATFINSRARPRARAIDYSGRISTTAEQGDLLGLAMLDHPDNVRHPTDWYVIAGDPMSFFNAALLTHEALVLDAGQTMTLRYRLILHPDRWQADDLAQAVDDWQQTN